MATVKLNLDLEIEDTWVDSFMSMLRQMKINGDVGHSGWVGIYADGDGDFNLDYKVTNDIKYDDNSDRYITGEKIGLYRGDYFFDYNLLPVSQQPTI